MRIAFIVPAPFDLLTGGYEYDRHMVSEWRTSGHIVEVLELGGHHPYPDDGAISSARQIWAGLPPDCTIVIDNLGLASFRHHSTELSDRGVFILNHHPTGLETGLDSGTSEALIALERQLLPAARHVIATSPTTAATLVSQFAIDPKDVTVVEPGTDEADRSVGSGSETVNILSIGSLIPRKGHDCLMRALARLSDLDWHLTIAGSERHDPVTAEGLRGLPETLGIARRVRFCGEMRGAPLKQLWREADLFALATHYEGYGMVIAEALKRGLPVAVCNGGAAGALVAPATGVVCPVGDVDQLSKALRRLIFDGPLRHTMADAAWAAGQELPNWQGQAAKFAGLLA
jgi:glycosyltransferase involved in cell wall biosynthesis